MKLGQPLATCGRGAAANGFVAINAACSSANCSKTLTIERSLTQGNSKALYTSVGNTVLRTSEWLNNGDAGCPEVIYGLQTMTYNLNEALQPGTGNKSADPKFVNAPTGDFTPSKGSPAIDNGSPSGAPSDDFNGKPRPVGDGPDMGAIEVQ